MPFKSKAQQGYLYANKPSVAKKFQKDTPSIAGPGVRKGGSSAASPKKGGALPAKVAKPISGSSKGAPHSRGGSSANAKGKNRKGSR